MSTPHDTVSPWLTWPIGIAFLLLLFWLMYKTSTYREQGFERFARENGLEPESGSHMLDGLSRSFWMSRMGERGMAARHCVAGAIDEFSVAVFDCHFDYSTGTSGRRMYRYPHTVAVICSPDLNLPLFLIRRKRWYERLIPLRRGAIDLPARPRFANRHFVMGNRDRVATEVLSEPLMSAFENRRLGVLEGKGDTLIYYIRAKQQPVGRLTQFLREAISLCSLLRDASVRSEH